MYFPETLYTIDILFAAAVLFFAICGTRNGFSGELAHVLMLLTLLIGVCFFYPRLIERTSESWRTLPPAAVQISVSVSLVLAALLLFVLSRALLKQFFKSKLGGLSDQIGGGVLGALRGGLFGLALLVGLSLVPNDSLYRTLSEQSFMGGWVCNTLTPWVEPRIQKLPVVQDRLSERLDGITP